eukprot:scaffold148928_cov53-Attheya_sp.AAC.3
MKLSVLLSLASVGVTCSFAPAQFRVARSAVTTWPLFAVDPLQVPSSEQQQEQQDFVRDSFAVNKHAEYATLLPGHMVQIRVGDISQSRKAWKKRRRSGSPILVPCSVLGMDRHQMVRWNLISVLYKYGESLTSEKWDSIGGGRGGGDGIVLTAKKLIRLYERDLGGSIRQHANAFGFKSSGDFLVSLFDEQIEADYGVEVVRGIKEHLLLVSSMPRGLAKSTVASAGLAQFVPATASVDAASSDVNDTTADDVPILSMAHTGIIKVRHPSAPVKKGSPPMFNFESLGAAVRIIQKDVDSRIQEGSILNAHVFSYDALGDGGNPLLTLSIDPPRGQVRHTMKGRARTLRQSEARAAKLQVTMPELRDAVDLTDLKVGDGPFSCRVIRVSSRAGAAFVDGGIARTRGKKQGGGTTKVLGMLRFDDMVEKVVSEDSVHTSMETSSELTEEEAAIIERALMLEDDDDEDDAEAMSINDLFMTDEDEDDEEIEEDVSALFEVDEDGNLSYTDPESGVLGNVDDDEEDVSGEDEDEDDMFLGMSPEERLNAIGLMLDSENDDDSVEQKEVEPLEARGASSTPAKSSIRFKSKKPRFLQMGDDVDVYIKAVFPQSGRFMVTLDPSIKEHKWKDVKNDAKAEKRTSRLAAKFGGEAGLARIEALEGTEIGGTVQAKSRTGDWFYVQPDDTGDEQQLPVGVAMPEIDSSSIEEGDRVLVRLEGIDKNRGQISMTVLKKLE